MERFALIWGSSESEFALQNLRFSSFKIQNCGKLLQTSSWCVLKESTTLRHFCAWLLIHSHFLLCEKWLQQCVQTERSDQPDVQANAIQNCAYITNPIACKTGAVFATADAVMVSFMHIQALHCIGWNEKELNNFLLPALLTEVLQLSQSLYFRMQRMRSVLCASRISPRASTCKAAMSKKASGQFYAVMSACERLFCSLCGFLSLHSSPLNLYSLFFFQTMFLSLDTPEENPYCPTYIFPELPEIQQKPEGTRSLVRVYVVSCFELTVLQHRNSNQIQVLDFCYPFVTLAGNSVMPSIPSRVMHKITKSLLIH